MEDLCDNLLDDILYRLPLKSVVTCKSISKRFNTFISDPGFESKLSLHNSCIFHCTKDCPNFYFKVPLYPPNSDKATESSVKLPRRFKVLAYCSGLLLLFPTEGVLVLNPVTKRHQIIDICHYDAIGLAVEPISSSLHRIKVVRISVSNGDSYQFDIFSSDTMSWRRSSTKFTCMVMSNFNNDALPIYSHGTLHWIRKCNDILAFDIEKEEARIIELPLNLPLPFEYWTSWFGVVNGENGEFCMYDIATHKWRKIGIVWAILDSIRAFVPFVPSLAEIKTTPWPDVSTRVVQSIHKLSLLLGAGVTLKKDVLQLNVSQVRGSSGSHGRCCPLLSSRLRFLLLLQIDQGASRSLRHACLQFCRSLW
ncbi:hypothetical protein CMV_003774 [Castanea mollissima]|uniref:F-box domain-containing protein n=1 Tax=Castanea mollissima TaxID=60419 RepID=A0A8J4RNG0_9ROSI|nr:hypothetical protein CMV_003774 [Castanea mollissima]